MTTRIRVRSTREGFNGRKAGTHFDVTAAEFNRYGPNGEGEDKGLLEVVPGKGTPATAAAIRAAAESGVDLATVRDQNPTARQVTAAQVKEAAKGPNAGK